MAKIVEFEDRYPDYKLGFLAENKKTETERLSGLRMHLLYSSLDSKTYQCFSIPEGYYDELVQRLDKLTSSSQWVVMTCNDAEFYLQKIKDSILGVCKQTLERVAIDLPIRVVITPEEEREEEYENYMDGLGGDWQG